MPYPSQINRQQLIDEGIDLVMKEGIDALSLSRLAAQVGVKPPSLYNHFPTKHALLSAMATQVLGQLFARIYTRMDQAADPRQALRNAADEYRRYATTYPTLYMLVFSPQAEARPSPDTLEQAAFPLQAVVARFKGDDQSLTLLRGLFALIHGWVMLEIAGQFQRGGDLGQAFDTVIQVFLA